MNRTLKSSSDSQARSCCKYTSCKLPKPKLWRHKGFNTLSVNVCCTSCGRKRPQNMNYFGAAFIMLRTIAEFCMACLVMSATWLIVKVSG